VALFRYTAVASSREDYAERGTIIAATEEEAKKKLSALRFDHVRLHKVRGLRALLGRLTATIK
jgi:type II secretory pathway component PulF